MKIPDTRKLRQVALVLAAAGALGGCAIVPYDGGYYGQPAYVAPVYVAPSVNFGFGYHDHGYYGPRYRRW